MTGDGPPTTGTLQIYYQSSVITINIIPGGEGKILAVEVLGRPEGTLKTEGTPRLRLAGRIGGSLSRESKDGSSMMP